jgi:hypothetical protein
VLAATRPRAGCSVAVGAQGPPVRSPSAGMRTDLNLNFLFTATHRDAVNGQTVSHNSYDESFAKRFWMQVRLARASACSARCPPACPLPPCACIGVPLPDWVVPQGTRDDSAYLAAPEGLKVMQALGVERVRKHNLE